VHLLPQANGKAMPYRERPHGTGIAVGDGGRAEWCEAWAFLGDVAYVWHAGVYSDGIQSSIAITLGM
jgi:hypothetical protein